MSARTVTFGARVPASGPASSVDRLKDSTRIAEDVGYDAVGSLITSTQPERHSQYRSGWAPQGPVEHQAPHQFETIAPLSYLAGMTEKVESDPRCGSGGSF